MKHLFYFLFGILTAIIVLLFGIEQYGREVIQDYWIEKMWYGDLKQWYDGIKTIIISVYLLCIIAYTYIQGINAATRIKVKFENDENDNQYE